MSTNRRFISREEFLPKLQKSFKAWDVIQERYRFVAPASKTILVVSTAMVSIAPQLKSFLLSYGELVVTVLSVVAAVTAALDAYGRPREKRKKYLESRDKCEQILIQVRSTEDPDCINQLWEEFIALESRHHRELNY